MSRRIKVELTPAQADALFDAAARGIDEWGFELDDDNGTSVTPARLKKAEEAIDELTRARRSA